MPQPLPGEIRIYLCASGPDMGGERALLTDVVRPELLRRLAIPGLAIAWIDSEGDPALPRDLAARLEQIDACRPFFVGLLGERDFGVLETADAALLARHPWLRARPPAGAQEIETAYALTQGGGAPRSFFYLRDPAFAAELPEAARAIYRPASAAEARRTDACRDEIRRSGRPSFDGYPCRWDAARGQVGGLEELAERLISDLAGAIREQLAAPAADALRSAGSAPATPLAVHEDVQFTIYRPRVVEPLKWETLLAFAHLSDRPLDAPPDELDPLDEVKKRAGQLLGDRAARFVDVRGDSAFAIPDEAEITFVPSVPGCDFNPPRCTFLWFESVHQEEFRLRAHPHLDGRVAQGRFSIFWGSLLLAEIQLNIKVDSRGAAASGASRAAAAARPFGSVFASYSHRDAAVVEEMERAARVLGHRYLRDVHDLRAGEVWSERLEQMIQQADIFQLFWSWNALRSPHVEREWRYALALERPNFVRPTYWEEPLPSDPERDLPPRDLGDLHFELLPRTVGGAAPPAARPVVVPARRDLSPPDPPAPATRPILVAVPPLPPTPAAPAPIFPAAPPAGPAQPAAAPFVEPLVPDSAVAAAPRPRRSRSVRWMGTAALFLAAVLGLGLFLRMTRNGEPALASAPSAPTQEVPAPPDATSSAAEPARRPTKEISSPPLPASQETPPSRPTPGRPWVPMSAVPLPGVRPPRASSGSTNPQPADLPPIHPAEPPSAPGDNPAKQSSDPEPPPYPGQPAAPPVDLSELWAKAQSIAQREGGVQVAVVFHNNGETPLRLTFDAGGSVLSDEQGQRYPVLHSDLSGAGAGWRLELPGGGSRTAHFYIPVARLESTSFSLNLVTESGQPVKIFGLPLTLEGAQ